MGDAKGAQRPVVIGEAMDARVIPHARSIGADWYDPGASSGNMTADLEANRQWLRAVMAQGRPVIDIGPQRGRRHWPGPTSAFYRMELEELANYPHYERVEID